MILNKFCRLSDEQLAGVEVYTKVGRRLVSYDDLEEELKKPEVEETYNFIKTNLPISPKFHIFLQQKFVF